MKHAKLTHWIQRTIIIFQATTIKTTARQLREAQAQVMELEKVLDRVPPCQAREFFDIDGGPYKQSFTTTCSLHVGHFGYHEAPSPPPGGHVTSEKRGQKHRYRLTEARHGVADEVMQNNDLKG